MGRINVAKGMHVMLFLLLALQNSMLRASDEGSKEWLNACSLARAEFAKKIDEKSSKHKWEYSDYVGNIENYAMGVAESRDSFIVVFVLKKTTVKINGTGAEYVVDKSTMQISRTTFFK